MPINTSTYLFFPDNMLDKWTKNICQMYDYVQDTFPLTMKNHVMLSEKGLKITLIKI